MIDVVSRPSKVRFRNAGVLEKEGVSALVMFLDVNIQVEQLELGQWHGVTKATYCDRKDDSAIQLAFLLCGVTES